MWNIAKHFNGNSVQNKGGIGWGISIHWGEQLKGRSPLRELCIGEGITLRWILNMKYGRLWAGFYGSVV
jgi:hypothetical protein